MYEENTCGECFWFDSTYGLCTADATPIEADQFDPACESFDERD